MLQIPAQCRYTFGALLKYSLRGCGTVRMFCIIFRIAHSVMMMLPVCCETSLEQRGLKQMSSCARREIELNRRILALRFNLVHIIPNSKTAGPNLDQAAPSSHKPRPDGKPEAKFELHFRRGLVADVDMQQRGDMRRPVASHFTLGEVGERGPSAVWDPRR